MANKLAGGVKAGTTGYSTDIVLRLAVNNSEVTAKVAADLTATYWRQGGTPTAIVLSDLAALTDAWSSGGVLEADAATCPGTYRLDLPDAALAVGADWVEVNVFASGTFVFKERLALESVGAAEVFTELSALPSAAGVWDTVVETEGTITARQALDIVLCVLAGVTQGGGLTMRTPNGAAVRVVGVTNGVDERTAVTLTPSA